MNHREFRQRIADTMARKRREAESAEKKPLQPEPKLKLKVRRIKPR